jgi:hypothetical protein
MNLDDDDHKRLLTNMLFALYFHGDFGGSLFKNLAREEEYAAKLKGHCRRVAQLVEGDHESGSGGEWPQRLAYNRITDRSKMFPKDSELPDDWEWFS